MVNTELYSKLEASMAELQEMPFEWIHYHPIEARTVHGTHAGRAFELRETRLETNAKNVAFTGGVGGDLLTSASMTDVLHYIIACYE